MMTQRERGAPGAAALNNTTSVHQPNGLKKKVAVFAKLFTA